MRIDDIRQRLRALGARDCHEQRLMRHWAQARADDAGRRPVTADLPRALAQAWPGLRAELDDLVRVTSEHPAEDASVRLLLALADGTSVEGVLLPREGVCVSTQVGCAVGCVFCMTGRDGLVRQLGSAEIVAQVLLARARRPVRRVVFMGMGEPAHNLDAVMEAIDFLGTEGGIGHKNLVFSTVGDRRAFERLAQGRVKPALALSLHSTSAARREALLPRAPRIAPDELVALADDYARATGHPIQVQWTLMEGVNDGADELEGLARLMAGRHMMLNMIPWNTVPELPFRRPPMEVAQAAAAWLQARGVLTKLRRSAGQDVEGGCGQLRARVLPQEVVLRRAVRGRNATA